MNKKNIPFADDYNNYQDLWGEMLPQINENIAKYRKAKACVEVVDKSGNYIENADISIKQISHVFHFGCNGLMINQFDTEQQNERYEQLFVQLFNTITTTLCFGVYSPAKGEYTFDKTSWRRPSPDSVAEFAKKHNLVLKGQPLIADSWIPKWAPDDADEVRQIYIDYFNEVNRRYSDKFDIFDMVNEAFLCKQRTPDFPLYNDNLDYVDWAFEQGQKIFPKSVDLELNENTDVNTGEAAKKYYLLAKRIMDKNVRLDSIGFQFHMFTKESAIEHICQKNLNPRDILKTYTDFCSLNKPLYISEITVPSEFGCGREIGEQLQAEIVENLYRLWFSIPNMDGIIYWNLKDGPAWKTEGDCLGCLVNSDMQPKPSYFVLDKLINSEWKTNITAKTDGKLCFDGFFGNYCADIVTPDGKHISKQFAVKKNENNNIKIIIDM